MCFITLMCIYVFVCVDFTKKINHSIKYIYELFCAITKYKKLQVGKDQKKFSNSNALDL